MDSVELLKINLFVAHDAFAKTVADVTKEMADWVPPAMAHPIGERWAHAVAGEDWLVNGLAQGQSPMFSLSWAGKTGYGKTSELSFFYTNEMARAFRLDDLDALRTYQDAVFAASTAYLNGLSEADMDKMVDMSAIGYGQVPAPAWWSTFVIGHLHDVMGEISILKGCLGFKGYPF